MSTTLFSSVTDIAGWLEMKATDNEGDDVCNAIAEQLSAFISEYRHKMPDKEVHRRAIIRAFLIELFNDVANT